MARDIMAEIKKLQEQEAPEEEIAKLVEERRAKIDSDSQLSQYEESQAALEEQYMQNQPVEQDPFDIQRELLAQQAGSTRQGALSALESERAKMMPTFQQERNQISGQAAQGAKALDEYLARAGLVGSTTQGQLAQQQRGQEQSLLGQSQMAETQFIGDLARRRSDIENQYQQALQQVGLQIGLQQAMANQQAQQQAFENQLAQAQLTGQFQGSPTMQAQQQQFQQQMAINQFDEAVRQNNLSQSNWQQQFTYQQAQDRIMNQYRMGQLSLQQAQQALAEAKFNAEQDPNSLDNQLMSLQLQQMRDSMRPDYTPPETTPYVYGEQTFGLTKDGEAFISQVEQSDLVVDDEVGRQVDRIGIREMLEKALEDGEIDTATAREVYKVYDLGNIAESGNVLNPMLLNPNLGLGVGE